MPARSFFRDVQMPSHRQDRLAHERFRVVTATRTGRGASHGRVLLGTHAQRRAEAKPRPTSSSLLTRLLALVGRRAQN